MLKRLRWKYILLAESALALVLFVLVLSLNLTYYSVSMRSIDRALETLSIDPSADVFAENAPEQNGLFKYTLTSEIRFFYVSPSFGGSISLHLEHVSSVSAADAKALYRQAVETEETSGFVGQFRFLRSEAPESAGSYFFIDCSFQRTSFLNLLHISVLLSVAALIAVFIVLYFLSPRFIQPVVDNLNFQHRFITDASHEMKTPLTVISSYADLMCMQDETNEWAKGIRKQTTQLSSLVSDLVLLSRWDEERDRPPTTPFDLSQSVWDTLTPYQHLAGYKGKAFSSSIADGITFSGDESAIQTAFATVLENAVKYCPEDGSIAVSLSTHRQNAVIEVSNTYAGEKIKDPSLFFQRFYRADPSRSRSSGGNGVGLSITKAIVEAHGGKVKAAYRDPDQIVFSLSLPLS